MNGKQPNMNKTENGEGLKTSVEARARGLKRVGNEHRKHLKNLTLKDCKSRVNIMLDADIVEYFKEQAGQKGSLPYQTQINQALRQFVENAKDPNNEAITMKMLDNPEFISKLIEKLKIV
jgi:uncharacterized protein (DUF4415 family)